MNKSHRDSALPTRRPAGETADQYPNVVAASGRWRIIRCRDDIQFIVQRRAAGSWMKVRRPRFGPFSDLI